MCGGFWESSGETEALRAGHLQGASGSLSVNLHGPCCQEVFFKISHSISINFHIFELSPGKRWWQKKKKLGCLTTAMRIRGPKEWAPFPCTWNQENETQEKTQHAWHPVLCVCVYILAEEGDAWRWKTKCEVWLCHNSVPFSLTNTDQWPLSAWLGEKYLGEPPQWTSRRKSSWTDPDPARLPVTSNAFCSDCFTSSSWNLKRLVMIVTAFRMRKLTLDKRKQPK